MEGFTDRQAGGRVGRTTGDPSSPSTLAASGRAGDPGTAAPGTEKGQAGAIDSNALRPGDELGPYTLLLRVGQGGMARVWAAKQVGEGGVEQLVAFKTVMPALARDKEFAGMVLDEARIASAVHHPNVCEILDLGELGNVLFLALEWVDGVSLLRLFKAQPRTPLEDAIAVRIIADACAGLHAAHELCDQNGYPLGIVHRDVSPHNVLVSVDGQVKVADFGVARAMGLENAPTMAGELKGKVAYMSPEQAVGDNNVDRRSDIFSLGAVLYEAVTGHRALAGGNDIARLKNLVAGKIIPPTQTREDIPRDLEEILTRALALKREDRYETAEEMRLALEGFLVARALTVLPSDIANTVRQLCAQEIEEQQQGIRQAAGPIADDSSPPSQKSLADTVQRPPTRGMRRSTATAITFVGGGITIAGLLGIAALSSLPSTPAVAASSAPATAALPQPPKRKKSIAVKPTPSTAVVEVNGVVLGKGVRSFARPAPGETHTVVVRAPGYKPSTITIGPDVTESAWRVELAPLEDAEARSSPSATAVETSPPRPAAAPTKTGVKPRTVRNDDDGGTQRDTEPVIPENPF